MCTSQQPNSSKAFGPFLLSLLFLLTGVAHAQGPALSGNTGAKTAQQDDAALLFGSWQMIYMTYEDGAKVVEQKEGERDLLVFKPDHTVNIAKATKEATGSWKFSPSSWELMIMDKTTGASVQYVVKTLTKEQLVLFYYDEIKRSKLLYFIPK